MIKLQARCERRRSRVQLPIRLGLNLLLIPGEHVLWRDVADGRERFQVRKLTVNPDGSATLTTEDGNDNLSHTEKLWYTDFPLREVSLWSVRNERYGFTIMLPSEY